MSESSLVVIVTAVIAATPATLIALATLKKAKNLISKTENIHMLTNSNFDRISSELKEANEKVKKLEQSLSKKKVKV